MIVLDNYHISEAKHGLWQTDKDTLVGIKFTFKETDFWKWPKNEIEYYGYCVSLDGGFYQDIGELYQKAKVNTLDMLVGLHVRLTINQDVDKFSEDYLSFEIVRGY